MSMLKIEELSKNDDVVLWSSLGGDITALVKAVEIRQDGEVRVTFDELEWAALVAPLGTEVDLV